MKKLLLVLTSIGVVATFGAFKIISIGGIIGATGSPGEGYCMQNGCHAGGPSGTAVSFSASPSFSNNNQYDPAQVYTVSVIVSHPSLTHFGFDCEILNASNANAGVMSNAGSGVQFANFGTKKNATHTAPKAGTGSASFTFVWTPPASGNATIYAAGNAVNNDGNTTGDFAVKNTLTLSAITATATGIQTVSRDEISQISVFPNPANEFATISYFLMSEQAITAELMDMSGKTVKVLVNERAEPGPHSTIIDLKGVAKGVYFVKTFANGKKVSQKLISVQ